MTKDEKRILKTGAFVPGFFIGNTLLNSQFLID